MVIDLCLTCEVLLNVSLCAGFVGRFVGLYRGGVTIEVKREL